jgi:hypothetical protein
MNKEQALANILEKVEKYLSAVDEPMEYVGRVMCVSEYYQELCDDCDTAAEELIATIKKELE